MDYRRGELQLICMVAPLWQPQLTENISDCWQVQRIQGRCSAVLCPIPLAMGSLCTIIAIITGFEPIYSQINCFWFSYLNQCA